MKRRSERKAARESQAEELLCHGRCCITLALYASHEMAEKGLAPSNLARGARTGPPVPNPRRCRRCHCPDRSALCDDNVKLTSARSSPVKPSASKKFTTIFGWSVLWIMIWDTSIWRLACWNRWKIPSAQKCYLCSRYVVLPMCPVRTPKEVVGRMDLNHRPPGP